MGPTPKQLELLSAAAKEASERAYVPYSHFPVGAAVLTSSGAVFVACNVENASYGLSMCAERNAIFKMASNGERHVTAVAIFTPTNTPSAPCGACRQVISEFGPEAMIFSSCNGKPILAKRITELLPNAFGPSDVHQGGEKQDGSKTRNWKGGSSE